MSNSGQFFCAGCGQERDELAAVACVDVYPETVHVPVCTACIQRMDIDAPYLALVEQRCEISARRIAAQQLSDKVGIPLARTIDPVAGMLDMGELDRVLGLPPGTIAAAAPYLAKGVKA